MAAPGNFMILFLNFFIFSNSPTHCHAVLGKLYTHNNSEGANASWRNHIPVVEKRERNLDVKRVHIIFMNHLDVGYCDFLDNILNLYFNEFFPMAIKRSAELKQHGYAETFSYTTHAWLVSMYLDCPHYIHLLPGAPVKCPSAEAVKEFTKAVHEGIITWHAGPMNMQYEFLDESLLSHALNLSLTLDQRFGIERKFRTLSQRDVPGMTQAIIPTLVKQGIYGITVGVNGMSAPPAVPKVFNWDYNGQKVIAMWHPHGYPFNPGPDPAHPGGLSVDDCVIVDGFDQAMCFAFRTDNAGPPQSIKEILNDYEILRAEFPNANIGAGFLEDFTEALYPIRDKLPTVKQEIGDTWINGIQSDPHKVAKMKLVMRNRAECLQKGECSYDDPRFFNSSRLLLNTGEHTWGRDDILDFYHWSNEAFSMVRNTTRFTNWTQEWHTQRQFTNMAIKALGNHPLAVKINKEVADLMDTSIDLKGFEETTVYEYKCSNGVLISFDEASGQVIQLVDPVTKISWASPENGLGLFQYMTYNQTDFDIFDKTYTFGLGHGNVGIYKPNITKNACPESKEWKIRKMELYHRQDKGDACEFYTHMKVDKEAQEKYGAPLDVWIHYDVTDRDNGAAGLDIKLYLHGKQATRMPEGLFFSFKPEPQAGHRWLMSKIGQVVDPMNVVLNGSQRYHAVESVSYVDASGNGIKFMSLDVAVISTMTRKYRPTPFSVPLHQTDQITGMSYMLFNNVWNVNWIYWYPFEPADKDFKTRFSIDFPFKNTDELNEWPSDNTLRFRPRG